MPGTAKTNLALTVYATCPSAGEGTEGFSARLRQVVDWCEQAGCRGALVYTDNSLADPWLIAQQAMQYSRGFVPLIAVQPVYQHPFTVARAISSISLLHGRAVDLNFVSGGFAADLASLGDRRTHAERYHRLVEYVEVVRRLLTGQRVSFAGSHYQLASAQVQATPPDELQPRMYLSGSSPDSELAARTLGIDRLSYPPPAAEFAPATTCTGIRIGVIARPEREEAWSAAVQRFPVDDRGREIARLVSSRSDSSWQQDLAHRVADVTAPDGDEAATYWLHPFSTYKTFCPYLVGSYAEVGAILSEYVRRGIETLILDTPISADDLLHTQAAISVGLEPVVGLSGRASSCE
ncbi:LLM class flavin-dependent oxidoreductase [Krasilnikovia sp. MM14-A1259]|uniref:LLM class flavin-dependent oxidoreductase n=1 Tax=Krasilnikovia sp. MM14-A1259 TaxID=3373539 RepID=UPI0038285F64